MAVIDIHTHAFPDALAARAIPRLEREADVKAILNGTVGALLESMDEAGIDSSVVLSIATKASQFDAIFEWSQRVRSNRLIPFPSVHPADPAAVDRIDQVAAAGFLGLKIHPYYQDFLVDEARLFPYYERCLQHDLILLCHTGYDIAFPRDRRATPRQIQTVIKRFPDLKFVASHLGAWDDWDDVRRFLIGRPLYTDLSYAEPFFKDAALFRELARAHPATHLLFGSDSPWGDQRCSIEQIKRLQLDPAVEAAVLGGNAERLLNDARHGAGQSCMHADLPASKHSAQSEEPV